MSEKKRAWASMFWSENRIYDMIWFESTTPLRWSGATQVSELILISRLGGLSNIRNMRKLWRKCFIFWLLYSRMCPCCRLYSFNRDLITMCRYAVSWAFAVTLKKRQRWKIILQMSKGFSRTIISELIWLYISAQREALFITLLHQPWDIIHTRPRGKWKLPTLQLVSVDVQDNRRITHHEIPLVVYFLSLYNHEQVGPQFFS